MALQQFKSEVGNNFNEHNLENILFEFYKEKNIIMRGDVNCLFKT
jgi:hypothetical protein